MFLIWRRYSRSGYAPGAFYMLLGAGFIGLAVWAATRGDWLVMALAIAMVVVTVAGSRIMRLMSEASEASTREVNGREGRDER